MANTDVAEAPGAEAPSAPPAPSPSSSAPSNQAITTDRAREVMQEAYRRSRGAGQAASMVTATQDAVDTPTRPAVQEGPTPAPREPSPAPSTGRPARPPSRATPPDQQGAAGDESDQPAADEAQTAEAEPPSPASEPVSSDEGKASAEPSAKADAKSGRSKAAAVLEQDEFQTDAWQRAFVARPDLRRIVASIVLDPGASPERKVTLLQDRLQQGLDEASAQADRRENLRALREVNPPAYVDQLRQQEAEQAQLDLLTRQATLVMAAAAGADPDDPAFLDAGPKEGEGYEVGLERLGDFLINKGDRVKQHVEGQRAEWEQAKSREIAALRAQFEKDKAAAVEQALGQARSPFGRFQPPPRATGNGVVPVGEQDTAEQAPAIDLKNPTLSIRGALQEGYRRRGGGGGTQR